MIKKRYLFLILIVCFFAVSTVSGAEIGNDTNMQVNDYDSGLIAESVSEEEIQGSADNGTFTALQKKIDDAEEGSTIILENDYAYDSGFSTEGIYINKNLTINGNGYVVDALGHSRIFKINSPTITLKNITFKNGHSNGNGGAIYFESSVFNSSISGEFINNAVFKDFSRGGAIYFESSVFNSSISGEFINNTSKMYGGCGAICFEGSVFNSSISGEFINNTPTTGAGAIRFGSSVSNCNISGMFIGNTAFCGSAIYFASSVSNSSISGEFINNTALDSGTIYFASSVSNSSISGEFINNYGYGGTICFEGSVSNSSISGEFINNTAINTAGAIEFGSSVSNCNVSGEFINNTVGNGGAIFFWGSVSNCNILGNFTGNNASNNGGAIYFYGGNIYTGYNINITCCNILGEFINNTAGSMGGAIYFECSISNSTISGKFINNTAGSIGGAIYSLKEVSNSTIFGEFINNSANASGGAISGIFSNSTISGKFINNTANQGGAIYFKTADLVINDCSFINNSANASGGVIFSNGNLIINSCNFINNSAGGSGSVIYLNWCENAIIRDCKFINNVAQNEGTILSFADLVINSCSFINNSANRGGAIVGRSNIINSSFINNSARFSGGAISGDSNIINSSFINNSARFYGGAVYLSSDQLIISNCSFINNSAEFGGAVYLDTDNNISNCSFINNSAEFGGAIYIKCYADNIFSDLSFINNTAIRGGAIFSTPTPMGGYLTIENSDFINNSADNGSSIYILEYNQLCGNGITIFDSYFYSDKNKEFIYSNDSQGYLFLKNNTMISPLCYKIYTKLSPFITSKKYLILENKTCYINKPFSLTYTDDNGNKVRLDKDIPITFVNLNNKDLSFEINATFDSNSGFYYIYCNQTGVYNLSVDKGFSNNFTIIPTILEVHSVAPDLSINVNNKSYSENTTFYVDVTVDDYLVNEGNINFYMDDEKVGSAIVSNGLAIFNYTHPKAGNFSILAIYEENDNYLSANMTALFTVNKMPTVLSAESVIFDEKGDKIFTAALKDDNSNGVSGQNVKIETIKYSGESRTFNGITDMDGIAEYNVKNLGGGMWFVTGTYDGNGNYINSKFTDKFIVIRMDTTTNIEGIDDHPTVNHTYKLKANIHDENGKLVKEGIVQFYLDGVDIGSIDLSKNQGHQSGLLGASNSIDYILGEDDSDLYIEYTPSKAGNYTLFAVYEGTTIYRSSNETTTLIVSEGSPVDINAPELIKYYRGSERFVATVKENNLPVIGGKVTFTIDGGTYSRNTNDNGQASIAINLLAGAYDVIVKYKDTNVTSKVIVITTISAEDVVKYYGNDTPYYATFKDSEGNYLSKGTSVIFNLNGIYYDEEIIDNKGTAKLDINEKPGTYILTATNTVNGEMRSNNITVLPIIGSNDFVKYYNETDKFTVMVITPSGYPASGQKVKFTIKNDIYETISNSNGYAFLDAVLQPDKYIVTTSFGGLDVNNTITILPTLHDKDMNVSSSNIDEGEKEIIGVVLPNDATGKVSTTINGKEYSATVNKGKANIIIPDLKYGNYKIEVIYSGNSHYNSVKGKTSFIVNKTIELSAPDVTKYYGGPERFYVTLKDKNSQPIANANIKININGVDYDRTTDTAGQTSIPLSIPSGNYTATVEYGGIKTQSHVEIKPTISGKNITKIFKNATQYSAKFLDTNGNILKNTQVIFNINGVFYTRTTNENGFAKLNINLNPDKYIITAGNPVSGEMYSNVVTVLPNIVENYDLTKYYKNASQYVIRVLDDQGRPVSGQSVSFNINGVFYTRTSNATGHVSMNINLNPGTYIITAIYKDLMVSNTITVKPILQAKDLNMKYKSGSQFEAKLLDGQGKAFVGQKITFNINGLFYDRTTDADGFARLNINLMPGEYIITSMYENGATIANKITISS